MADENKVTFTAEQQEKINELIREAQGRAAKETRTQLETTQTELTAAKQKLVDAEAALASKAHKPDVEVDDVAKLRSRVEEMERASLAGKGEVERLRQVAATKEKEANDARQLAVNIRKQVAIQAAASKAGFISVDAAAKMTGDVIEWSDERSRFVVMNGKGSERLNAAYEPMTLEEFYTEYAAENPWMVRGDAKGGSGSTETQRSALSNDGKYLVEQIFGVKSNATLAQKLKRENPREYARLKDVARSQGLVA